MSESDWDLMGAGGRIVLAAVAIHGITSRRWQTAHTVGVLMCLVALAGREVARN